MTKRRQPERDTGSVAEAVRAAFRALGSPVTVFGTGASCEGRMAQFFDSGAELRVSGWDGGVCIFSTGADDLDAIVGVLVAWLDERVGVSEIVRRFPHTSITESASSHFRGVDAEVEAAWQQLRGGTIGMDTLVEAAYARPELRALFPYTSHGALCFSRCTGYPYTTVDPSIISPTEHGRGQPDADSGVPLFVVGAGVQKRRFRRSRFGGVLKAASPDEAVDLAVGLLPDAGPTRQGTADRPPR